MCVHAYVRPYVLTYMKNNVNPKTNQRTYTHTNIKSYFFFFLSFPLSLKMFWLINERTHTHKYDLCPLEIHRNT